MEQLGRFHFLDLNGKDVAQDRKGTEEKDIPAREQARDPGGKRKRHPSGSSVRMHPDKI